MKRLPASVLVLVISAALLGLWMAFEGLHLRLFGNTWSILGAAGPFWRLLGSLGVKAQDAAWPLITVGTAWVGAVCCVLIRLGGIQRIVLILGIFSLLFIFPGTALGAIVLVCLLVPGTRAWLAKAGEDAAV